MPAQHIFGFVVLSLASGGQLESGRGGRGDRWQRKSCIEED